MTRRVRFTPRDRFRSGVVGLSLVGLLASAGGAAASEVPFGPAAVVGTPSLPAWLDAGDLDRDGDRDFASAGNFGIAWHENVGGAGSSWTTHTVATDGIYRSALQGDVDQDGDVDLLAASPNTDRILWYENTAGNGSAWTRHTIGTGIDGPRYAVLADVDGDGDPDVVSNAVLTANVMLWYENTAGNGTTWVRRTIATGVDHASIVAIADVDRDGDLDAMAASANGQTVAWYENVAGTGRTWATRTIANPSNVHGHLVAADVDGDGDIDAVASPFFPGPLLWFENVDGHGGAWTARTIATPTELERSISVADVDGDGDVDVMAPVGNVAPGTAVWYENVDGAGTTWTQRTIGTMGSVTYQVIAADVDGDGDQDAASVSLYGEILWYRNQSIHQDVCFVRQTDIATSPVHTNFGVTLAVADLDGDGDADALAGALENVRLVSYKNLSGSGDAWASQLIATSISAIETILPADLDQDGDVDFVSNPTYQLSAFRNGGDGSAWTVSPLSTPPLLQSTGFSDSVDLDADGDVDVVAPVDSSAGLLWFENAGNGTTWTPRTIVGSGSFLSAHGADVDGDGDIDVVAHGPGASIPWFENAGGAASWVAHTIAGPLMHRIRIGDIDGDGDPDVLSGTSGNTLIWLENSGNGSTWTVHTVGNTNPAPSAWADAADLDGDGDLDGLVSVYSTPGLVWYDNVAGDGSSWTQRPVVSPAPFTIQGRVGDLDSDGDPDVLTFQGFQSTIGWVRNDPGQVRLDAVDQVPPSVENGDVFSMLRVTVTHGGRAGDSDLELARLGLRFQEDTPAGPLSSAEANALVEELRIYRDANGNGTFDPGTDTLVATVPTLALTNGVQTIAFTDGDPNVRVALGTPAAFFVVAQLTANASEQGPNQFRVVHLANGPSATLAEDASADTALRTACPVDFASGLVGRITPVDLTGFSIE